MSCLGQEREIGNEGEHGHLSFFPLRVLVVSKPRSVDQGTWFICHDRDNMDFTSVEVIKSFISDSNNMW